MSDTNETPENEPDFFMQNMQEVRDKAAEALKNPPTITEKQKALLLTVGLTYVLFKIEKRMVKKVVKKAFETYPVRIDLASYMADLDAWDKAKYANWAAGAPR